MGWNWENVSLREQFILNRYYIRFSPKAQAQNGTFPALSGPAASGGGGAAAGNSEILHLSIEKTGRVP
ncbi:MAG: hypothetical protein MSF41_01175 [Oscillibacter sp.]|nr:hypothetical protein [Oscillibacter sp.]